MSYKKEEVKENLELEDIFDLMDFLGAEPQMFTDYITCKTVCHGGDSHKLYYYENTQLFKCFSGGCGSFDIFELISKLKDMDLNQSIYFVVNFFNLQSRLEVVDEDFSEDWQILNAYNKINEIIPSNSDILALPEYDLKIIQNYPQPRYWNWEQEGISKEVCDYMNIHFDPIGGNILIPHMDKNGRCIGIRQRTLIQGQEQFGKYKPWKRGKQMFNHPLAFNLYTSPTFWSNIGQSKIAIVFEAEKSVLQFLSYFGLKNDMSCAICGHSLSKYQFNLLVRQGVNEIVIAFDKDYHEYLDKDYENFINHLNNIYNKFGTNCNMSFIIDTKNYLDYKNSPTDRGKEIFLELFRNRIFGG